MKGSKEQIAMRVSTASILANVLLFVIKMIGGIVGRSAAMVSDAVHTLSDVLSTVIVMIGVKLAGKSDDADHHYGHERFECVAAILLSIMLFATGLGIGYQGLKTIIGSGEHTIAVPTGLALITAIISILVKEGMYWYTRSAAKQIDSGALMADAWHHRSDALSSVGSFVGILGAQLGYPILDPLACLVICLFIIKAAYDIFLDAIGKMTDKACDEKMTEEIRALIVSQEGVREIDLLKTRLFGDKIYIDVEIAVDGTISLYDSHNIAHQVHDVIEHSFPKIKHCMVHVNPYREDNEEENESNIE